MLVAFRCEHTGRTGTLTSVRSRRARPAGSTTPAQAARKPQVEIGRSENAAAPRGSNAKTDFRRAAPAAANRQVEHASDNYKE
ncbi:MAG TPA: hypothetical protein VHJ58_07930 [Vicinamibacterales bacterium]|jgi:hypothetical protein|nr:hypothetical protein [Vicinamibacterales bacterium]